MGNSRVALPAVLLLVLSLTGLVSAATTERVSVSSSGEQGNSQSYSYGADSLSADGRYVSFGSSASNLVAGDTNGTDDVFVHDRVTGTTERVSVSSSGEQGNQYSYGGGSLSADGRYVAFGSSASNLVAGDTNGYIDVFVHDRVTGTTERVSVSSSGEQGNSESYSYGGVSLSADGRYVAFGSYASNLVAGDTNGYIDVFVHDRVTGTTERVSVSSSGEQGNSYSYSGFYHVDGGSLSADGRYVAFGSSASNLVAGDTNGYIDVFVHDRVTGTTERVSVSSSGEQGNSESYSYGGVSLSADGRYVAFGSYASNLVAGDTNGTDDVFVHDRVTGTTERVNVSSSGEQGSSYSSAAYGGGSLSADGRYVSFCSPASNLVAGDTNRTWDVFVHDRVTGTTERVSVSSSGEQGNSDSYSYCYDGGSLSADGRYVAFGSSASNLVAGDTNGDEDFFVHDRVTGTTERVSVSSSGEQGNSDSHYGGSLSADGRYVSFSSYASNLVAGDTNGADDVFVRDRWGTGPPDEFRPRIASTTLIPDEALNGHLYALRFLVVNDGGQAGEVTIALDEQALSGFATQASYSPDSLVRTWTIPAYGERGFTFGIAHQWEWIDAPPATWQAILDGAISCLPVGLMKEWAGAIKAANDLQKMTEVYGYVTNLMEAYEVVSGIIHRQAQFRYLPGPGTTPGLSFDQTVTVKVPDWKTNAFWTSTGHSVAGTICSYAGDKGGVLGLPLLALQGVLKYAAREYYKIAYDPDPEYMTIPSIEPIAYPELEALPDSSGKAAALAAKAWVEAETALVNAWIRMAAAEEEGDEYWRRRQAQAAEELGREAASRKAEFLRLLPAAPGLQAGGTPDEVAAFRQDLETNGLPEIERAFLLRQGWSEDELDALAQSMIDTDDEIYQTPGLQADATVLAAAGALAQTHHAADIADTPSILLELPATKIVLSGTAGRDGKYVSDVLVLLEATTPTATAIAAIEYSLSEGTTWTPYADPFTISEDGFTVILARATDDLGQTEDPPARRVVTKRPSVFGDVAFGSWAWAQVEAAYWEGVVQGYEDGSYQPEWTVTRDQMAVYVARALGVPSGGVSVVDYEPPSEPSFEDIPDDHWAYKHIEYCVEHNVVHGYEYPDPDNPGETFYLYAPTATVTRDQMAVYVARALVAPSGEAALADYIPSDPRNFPDVPNTGYGDSGADPYWAYRYIEYCVEHGVVQGYEYPDPDTPGEIMYLYEPTWPVTRDQMAVYIARAFDLPI